MTDQVFHFEPQTAESDHEYWGPPPSLPRRRTLPLPPVLDLPMPPTSAESQNLGLGSAFPVQGSHIDVLGLTTGPFASSTQQSDNGRLWAPRSQASVWSAPASPMDDCFDLEVADRGALLSRSYDLGDELDAATVATEMALQVLRSDDSPEKDRSGVPATRHHTPSPPRPGSIGSSPANVLVSGMASPLPTLASRTEEQHEQPRRKGRARMSQEKRRRLARRKEREALRSEHSAPEQMSRSHQPLRGSSRSSCNEDSDSFNTQSRREPTHALKSTPPRGVVAAAAPLDIPTRHDRTEAEFRSGNALGLYRARTQMTQAQSQSKPRIAIPTGGSYTSGSPYSRSESPAPSLSPTTSTHTQLSSAWPESPESVYAGLPPFIGPPLKEYQALGGQPRLPIDDADAYTYKRRSADVGSRRPSLNSAEGLTRTTWRPAYSYHSAPHEAAHLAAVNKLHRASNFDGMGAPRGCYPTPLNHHLPRSIPPLPFAHPLPAMAEQNYSTGPLDVYHYAAYHGAGALRGLPVDARY